MKIKAILEQENWSELDVPDEYQAIVTSLFCLESDEPSLGITRSNGAMVFDSDGSRMVDPGLSNLAEHVDQIDSVETSGDGVGRSRPADNVNADIDTSVAQSSDANHRERGRSSCRTLSFKGVEYHMVNW